MVSMAGPNGLTMTVQAVPGLVEPMLAVLSQLPADETGWAFEYKWDGVRAITYWDGERLRMTGRHGNEILERYPEFDGLAGVLGRTPAVLDGEIVALDQEGRPSFQSLQRRMGLTTGFRVERAAVEVPVTYMIFDLLYLGRQSTMRFPYRERRKLLDELELAGPHWQAPRYHLMVGRAMAEVARMRGLEGVMCKRLESSYEPGRRSPYWLKVKVIARQEFVIGGWRPERGSAGRLGALLIGHRRSDSPGEPGLVYAGKVGTGFDDRTRLELPALLSPIERRESPFTQGRAPADEGTRFVDPVLVCEVEFREWTRDGTLRHPSYKGLRRDADPARVVRERTAVT